ncbi:hypothetical protein A4C53_RS08115 [Elizabethkingia anophelis]|uniref:Lipoprotein n=1 Tax=Elizabethkingia anophelis NUHP1 TaxID=1338011 RepID=A0A077EK46_9FLAO|nr:MULTISPECIES: hypothetical protein [Elizabethkingia]AIL46559.1 hypothetical protein BD94_2784 [Elizabethkingia anophelis NUHP1]EJG2051366.1 hypothetical protein [Elizabethkingia anophelis]EJG2059552.1 hypothetical protein [Elizabethkingia anophelis]EJG2063220.1 hypothetical protein [Elizabethkingia anophelis]EJG2067022.1 hypothetical protein [Elizabethkingia anophelis]
MKKNLFYPYLLGILTMFLLFACRTEDNLSQQYNESKQRFAIFVPQSPNEKVDYANGFAYLYQNYYDVNNVGKNQQKAVINNFGVVDFRIHSQLLKYKDGSKAMIFPIRQMGITKGLVMGILENEETNLRYVRLEESYEGYSGIIQNFSKNDKKVRISDLAVASMKKNDDVREHPDEPKRDDENGPTNPPEKTIPEVIIIVPAPLPTVPTIPIIPNVPVIPPGGGGCGAYGGCNLPPPPGGGTGTWSNDLLLFSKNPSGEKITNIKDYLKCLNLSQGATVTLYVAQPTPNTTSTWSGSVTDPNVGHTFISITQGGITRFMGFYPSQGISPFSSPPAAKGILINDQGHAFNVSITSNINASQLSNLVGYINSVSTATYNLNTFNCTNFGIDAAGKVGIFLPKTSGTWPGGGGANPGNLGQDLRGLNNSSVQKNTSGGNAPKNSGSCN